MCVLRALEQPGWEASLSCRIRLETARWVILRARCLLQMRLDLAAAVKRMSFSCGVVCEQMNLVETLSNVSCEGGGQLSSCKARNARLQLPERDL